MESAPPNSARKANCTGSGSIVFLACLTFAIWSMFTPKVAIILKILVSRQSSNRPIIANKKLQTLKLLIYSKLNLKKKSVDIFYRINPVLGFLAMFVTQDIVLRFFFSKKKIINNGFSIPTNSSIILAPTHRSRWDGLILTMAMGRRVTNKDCRFMVTNSEMRGIQGWFLKRLGCFSINQLSPSLSTLRYAINLIEKEEQLVVFPEGKINRYGKKLVLKEGLYRLALLATKKTKSITILPIGIAYSEVSPKFRSEFCLSFGEPIVMNDYLNTTIEEFNKFLNEKMRIEEEIALKNVGR